MWISSTVRNPHPLGVFSSVHSTVRVLATVAPISPSPLLVPSVTIDTSIWVSVGRNYTARYNRPSASQKYFRHNTRAIIGNVDAASTSLAVVTTGTAFHDSLRADGSHTFCRRTLTDHYWSVIIYRPGV